MRTRRLVTAAVVTVLVGGVLSAPVSQAAPPPDVIGKVYAVTLVTGDRVTVAHMKDTWEIRDIEPAKRIGGPSGYLRQAGRDGVTVIPLAAAPLIRDGRLDDALFDVTGLIRQGYDDARTKDTPLLVESGDRRAATALGRVTRQLPQARLTAVSAPKNTDVLGTVRAGAKVWLNGRLSPSLDESVPQIGADDAWAAGQTGAGATIAVLDTGYDPDHPDLAAAVTASQDFTGTGIRDEVGHGTHVASIAAGRGTASGGKYTGVAKGANLMIGKVCAFEDFCSYDAVIAGMQWAAESGARVVNMSFGGDHGDGTDPVETELNRLSAQYGTLFVVAAGNDGEIGEPVSTPATADAALAVASVSKQDVLSSFSSRGPRWADKALKPDIAAPGESIVAARAAGTLDEYAVDDHYARLDGTSMATPHVAGAAAIVAAQHPDWTGEQIKSTLMSTAHPIDAGVTEAGTGRVDVARAVSQPVTASPGSLSMGFQRWPRTDPVAPQAVTYRNTGDSDQTLDLALTAWDESGTPTTAFHTDKARVTVPAGGTATVTVTFDPTTGPDGLYAGRLVATGGDIVVQTTVGGYLEPESYDLTVNMIDRDGKEIPADQWPGGSLFVLNLADRRLIYWDMLPGVPQRVRAGHYSVQAIAYTPIEGGLPSTTLFAEPDVAVDKDTVVTVDARKGNRVGVGTERPDAAVVAGTTGMYVDNGAVVGGLLNTQHTNVYAVPSTSHADGFLYYNRAQVERPVVRLTVDAPESFEVPVAWVPDSPEVHGAEAYPAVDVGHATPDELAAHDLTGKLAVFTLTMAEAKDFDDRLAAIAEAGASAAMLWFSEPMGIGVGQVPAIPAMYTEVPAGGRLAALGTASVTVTGIPVSPYRYELVFPNQGAIPSTVDNRVRDRQLATVRAHYHAMMPDGIGWISYRTYAYGIDVGSGVYSTKVPTPVERTEYYTPVTWEMEVGVVPPGGPLYGFTGPKVTYRPGSTQRSDWGAAVIGPGLAVDRHRETGQPYSVAREGDTIRAFLPLMSDGTRHSGFADPLSFNDTGDTSLYADGRLLGSSGVPGSGEFTVPAGAADYRLTSSVTRDNPTWPLSTQVSAEWRFRSTHTDSASPLPLLAVGFAPKVDLLNYAKAGKRITIPVSVDRQAAAAGPSPALDSVEYSLDDGKTWVKVKAVNKNGHWEVTVPNPSSGFVSLRASASDRDGNSVTQTILRAYRVR